MLLRVISLVLAFTLAAQQASAAPPPAWRVDPAKSALTFSVVVNGQTVKGTFPGFSALIRFDPANLAQSSARITMDMTGIRTGDRTRDVMLMKPVWFNGLDFPQAVFQTLGFQTTGSNAYTANARLSLKGTSRDISLPFTLIIKGNKAVMKGETELRRLDYKVGQDTDFLTEKPVSLSVKVMVNITAYRVK